jgi:hypothetical protein
MDDSIFHQNSEILEAFEGLRVGHGWSKILDFRKKSMFELRFAEQYQTELRERPHNT